LKHQQISESHQTFFWPFFDSRGFASFSAWSLRALICCAKFSQRRTIPAPLQHYHHHLSFIIVVIAAASQQ
jgi:hypothetical protein